MQTKVISNAKSLINKLLRFFTKFKRKNATLGETTWVCGVAIEPATQSLNASQDQEG
jgi:hypothetical protein